MSIACFSFSLQCPTVFFMWQTWLGSWPNDMSKNISHAGMFLEKLPSYESLIFVLHTYIYIYIMGTYGNASFNNPEGKNLEAWYQKGFSAELSFLKEHDWCFSANMFEYFPLNFPNAWETFWFNLWLGKSSRIHDMDAETKKLEVPIHYKKTSNANRWMWTFAAPAVASFFSAVGAWSEFWCFFTIGFENKMPNQSSNVWFFILGKRLQHKIHQCAKKI